MTNNNNNNADKKCSDAGSSSTQIVDIDVTYLSSNISTDAISSTSASTTTIPMTSNSSSLSSTAAPVPAAPTTTTTTNTPVVVAAPPPVPSCSSSSSNPVDYVHKIFDNKSLKRKASRSWDDTNVTEIVEGVGGVSVGSDDNDEYSSTNNSATTTPCVDWGAQEQQVSGGISRSLDDTNVTEM
ncbi:unnamed protein product [Trichobilharzia regenti]|nr:unnamed protein product [Trichobilharzia regenti]